MTGTPLDLLSLVGLGTRLLGLGGGERASANGGFQDTLDAARSGELGSGRVVVSGAQLGVDLSADQLERLSYAADVAEAQGAETAAVLMDGMVIRLDVESRTALASTPAESAMVMDVDVVLSAGPGEASAPGGDALLRQLAPGGTPVQ